VPKKVHPDCISDCFDLYVKYNGSNFPAIEREMREKGWTTFTKQNIRKKVDGEYVGWESELGWQKALKQINENRGKAAMTSAEGLHQEVETVRTAIFEQIIEKGIKNPDNKWLLWEHGKYVAKTADILKSLDGARDNYANFVFFLKHLLAAATRISPDLAKSICEAEDALLDWAEKEFVTAEEKPNAAV
jgi:hypothetical protein